MSTEPNKANPRRLLSLLADQRVILILVFAVMVVFFTSQNPIFFSNGVFANILADWGPLVLIAAGETFVIITGGIDLSVGSTIGFSGIIGAMVMNNLTLHGNGEAYTLFVGTLVCAGVGLAVGLVNAVLINQAKLLPFIATLVTMGAAAGLSIVITGGSNIAGGPVNAILLSIPAIGPFSWPNIIVVVIVVILGLFLHKARFGRYTYAIGSNSFAARAAGININRHLTLVYALSGVLAGLAGMYFYIRLGAGAPTTGQGEELQAIAAVVIGGTLLTGGVGDMVGTIMGALILTIVTSGLIIIGVQPNWNQVVVAILIAVAVFAQTLRLVNRRSE